VSAGSNIDPRANLQAACAALQQRYGALAFSPVYESPAEGFNGPPFLNLVVSFATEDPPEAILPVLAELETRAGRDRSGYPSRALRSASIASVISFSNRGPRSRETS